MINKIPFWSLQKELLTVSKPSRYVGGEIGTWTYTEDQPLKIAISFPDKYEIGMSNQAVRILYNRFNAIDGIQCERVFAPDIDFEKVLREKDIPLFSIESGTPLHEFDIVAFSIGYELTLTNMLNIMDLGKIPYKSSERTEDHPLILAGGPAATNPIVFGNFVDAVNIGEGEPFIEHLGDKLVSLKKEGKSKKDLFDLIKTENSYWYKGKTEKTTRAIYNDFGKKVEPNSNMPIASLTTVQEHGVIEIMRGCPNGCRFCHAGYFYRPFRQKNVPEILEEADHLVNTCGMRNITLSSLSSGDYVGLLPLVEYLNKKYAPQKVSFQLPSLRVNSLNLDLLSQLSTVRKSGLTFAVETPNALGQAGLNKDVSRDRIVALLKEAKEKGWKLAKFYFMLGLPVYHERSEAEEIVDFLKEIQRETGVSINVNAGVFIPKPHTPYERSFQFNDEKGMEEIGILKRNLRGRNFKVGFHSPYASFVEGILTRGDERAGELLERAFLEGARFDAWDEHFSRDLWRKVISESDWDVEKEICSEKEPLEPLPWDNISLNVSKAYLDKEKKLSDASKRSNPCADPCESHCSICNKDQKVTYPEPFDYSSLPKLPDLEEPINEKETFINQEAIKAVIQFSKTKQAIYLGHLDTLHIFEKAIQCSPLKIRFTQGFNPKPRMEFAHPLSLGLEASSEIIGLELECLPQEDAPYFVDEINKFLPNGFKVEGLFFYPLQTDRHKKKKTMMSLYGGSIYEVRYYNEKSGNYKDLETLLNLKAKELEVGDEYEFYLEEDHLRIKAIFKNKKMNNIVKFLGAALEIEAPLQKFKIKRNEILALQKGVLKSYLELD